MEEVGFGFIQEIVPKDRATFAVQWTGDNMRQILVLLGARKDEHEIKYVPKIKGLSIDGQITKPGDYIVIDYNLNFVRPMTDKRIHEFFKAKPYCDFATDDDIQLVAMESWPEVEGSDVIVSIANTITESKEIHYFSRDKELFPRLLFPPIMPDKLESYLKQEGTIVDIESGKDKLGNLAWMIYIFRNKKPQRIERIYIRRVGEIFDDRETTWPEIMELSNRAGV